MLFSYMIYCIVLNPLRSALSFKLLATSESLFRSIDVQSAVCPVRIGHARNVDAIHRQQNIFIWIAVGQFREARPDAGIGRLHDAPRRVQRRIAPRFHVQFQFAKFLQKCLAADGRETGSRDND